MTPMEILQSIIDSDLDECLPVAYFICAHTDVEKVMAPGIDQIPLPLLKTLIVGKDRLRKIIDDEMRRMKFQVALESTCSKYINGLNSFSAEHRILGPSGRKILLFSDLIYSINLFQVGLIPKTCPTCGMHISDQATEIARLQGVVWDKLPEVFGLNSWDALKRVKNDS